MTRLTTALRCLVWKLGALAFTLALVGSVPESRAADPKSRSHFTAKGNRPSAVREAEERRAERDLNARMERERHRREKTLEKRLAREEARSRKDIERRLTDRESLSEANLAERLAAEKRAKEIELEAVMAEKRKEAEAAMAARLAAWEKRALESIDEELGRSERSLREQLNAELARDERAIEASIAKEIAREEAAARKRLARRMRERERLARAELESALREEAESARSEIDARWARKAEERRAKLASAMAESEKAALADLESELREDLGGRARFPIAGAGVSRSGKPVGSIKSVGGPQSSRSIKEGSPSPAYGGSGPEDVAEKRPSILGAMRAVPGNLLASIGNAAFGKERSPAGYLAYRIPVPLRFSNSDALTRRAPSAALPEFAIVAPSPRSIIEQRELSEEAIRRAERRNQIVVELEPYTILSGEIDTSIPRDGERREPLMKADSEETVVRPEEVLIFFENERQGGDVKTIVPFSPARPSGDPPARSGATYNRAE